MSLAEETSVSDTWVPSIELSDAAPTAVGDVDVVALPFHSDDGVLVLGPGAAELWDLVDVDLLDVLEQHGATGRAGDIVAFPAARSDGDEDALIEVVLLGTGAARPRDLRRAGAALARAVRGRSRVATSVAALTHDAGLRAFVEGLALGSFTFSRHSVPPEPPAATFVLAALARPEDRRQALDQAVATARAGVRSRALALTPSNEKNPPWLADQALTVAGENDLTVEVWDEHRLERDGFGGLLGVGRASATPPRLVRLEYSPAGATRRTPHVVLVGKGITFDTGGLSLKPADAMVNMKRDMTGAGVVLSVLAELGKVDCPVRVTGLMACAENAVDGDALRPGDVLRQYGGRTTEVTNTDAEGRLVLADAMAYAVDKLSPTVLVDVATLTGASKVALGQRLGAVFATEDPLAEHLLTAGRAAGEPVWRLPLVEEYADKLESPVADSDNAADGPGAIIAALFLKSFAGQVPWAHLDIAAVGDSPVDAYEWSKGPTGFGARLLLHWLELRDPLAGISSR